MSLIDDNDRHQIYLAKLTSHLLNSALYPSMAEAYKAARAMLLDVEDISSITALSRIQAQISRDVKPALREGWDKLTAGLYEMAEYEAEYAARLFGRYAGVALAVPASTQIERFVTRSAMSLTSGQRVTSGVWADYVTRSVDASVQQYNGLIASGYQQGLTVGQISRQLRDSTNGLLANNAQALARTGQSHFANQAREAMAAANKDIIKYRVFTATFDNRTTLQCRGNHGKSWAIADDDYPRIPLHFGCRSAYVFAESPEQAMEGKRSAVGGRAEGKEEFDRRNQRLEELREQRREQRADGIDPPSTATQVRRRGRADDDIFNPTPINASTSQDAWLRQQPAWFQDSALGPTRAKLLRDGGLEVTSFVDMLGKPIPLDELRRLDTEAFRRAGL